ncbi:hypothetical protein [Streptosporangium sp. NPDC020145]|uniref:hypothetical protein n=1 Tax=Streptosporangium sp. NPDC020145 TaxID=3154694 RepID=UPI003449493A
MRPVLKRGPANLAPHDAERLTTLVKTRLERMRYRPALLDGFVARAGLPLEPPRLQPFNLRCSPG